MIKTFPFRLDIEKEYNNRMYSVNSNDLKTVKFTFVVTDNGIPLDLTGLTVRIAIRKPDKKAVWQDCTVTNAPKGEVEVVLESQAYIKKGEHEAELMLYKGTDTVAITQKFHYRAAEGIMSDKSLKSETVLGPIDEKLAEVEGVIKDIRENGTGVDAKARQDIESVTTQLAETAKKSDINSLNLSMSNKRDKTDKIKSLDLDTSSNDYKIKPENVSDELMRMFSPAGTVSPVIPSDGVNRNHLANGIVSANKIADSYRVGKNLFNKYDITSGKWIDTTNGNLVDYAPQFTSHFIAVDPSTNYHLNVSGRRAFYTADKTFISSLTGADPLPFTTPPNAGFMRFSVALTYLDTAQLELGNSFTGYESFQFKVKGLKSEDEIYVGSVVTFANDDNLYVSQGNSSKNVSFKCTSIGIRYLSRYVETSFENIIAQLDSYNVRASSETVPSCIFLPDGYALFFDVSTARFFIGHYSTFKKNHIVVVFNSNGYVQGSLSDTILARESLNNKLYSTFQHKYFNTVRAKENEVISLQSDKTFTFGFSTDHHVQEWERGFKNEAYNVMNRIDKNLNLDSIINGGDLISYGRADKSIGLEALKSCVNKLNNKDKLFAVIGNHDYNGRSDAPGGKQRKSWVVKPYETYSIIGKHQEDKVVWGSKEYMYYYKDFENRKVRVIFLNSSDLPMNWINDNDGQEDYLRYDPTMIGGIRQEQASWLANTALNFSDKTNKSEWHTLIISHISLFREGDGMDWNKPYQENDTVIRAILKAFKEGASTTAQYTDSVYGGTFNTNVSVNFTNQGAMPLIGIFSGHNHLDRIVTSSYGLTNVSTTAAYPDQTIKNKDTNVVRDPNTYTEFALDIVTIDKEQRKVIMKRFGAGTDREFTY